MHKCGFNNGRLFGLAILFAIFYPLRLTAETPGESPVPGASVTRAQFTTAMRYREPVDQVVTLDNSVASIYFFSELQGLEGRTVTHRWEYAGRVISEVSFAVEGPRWRVYSRKTLDSEMLGKWTVIVVDQSGWPLYASIFEYIAKDE